MKSSIHAIVLLLISSFLSQVNAQEITGKVIDKGGLPIPGVNVIAEKTNTSTSTDFDGNFVLKVPVGITLKFSMVGFQTITREATSSMKITLVESNKILDEVVVVGYGSKKKGAVTGSVVQIKSEDIIRTPAQSAVQAIQGKAAGVNIVTNDEPGAAPTILIRGLGTLYSGFSPLFVIDGLEAPDLNGISANDIDKIDILKDASSLAIYGNKGANGVVFVTTKKGKKGAMKVSYDSFLGIKTIQKEVKLADAYRYAYYNNVASGSSTRYNLSPNTNTNWLKEITSTGQTTNNSISISGGNDQATYFLGASHYTEKGILNGTNYQRTNVNSRNEFKIIKDKVKITQNFNVSIEDKTPKPLSAFTNAYKQAPIMPVRYANGRYAAPLLNDLGYNDMTGLRYNTVANPVAQLDYTNQEDKKLGLFGNVGLEFNLVKDLKFNSSLGVNCNSYRGYSFTPDRDLWLAQNPNQNEADYPSKQYINTLSQYRSYNYSYNWDNYLTYTKKINKHAITAIVGMSRVTNNIGDYISGTRHNLPVQSNYWSFNFSSDHTLIDPDAVVSSGQNTPDVSIAYFARAEYTFDDKYLFTAIIRREGMSKFQPQKRWDNFPSVSAGWVISNESFFGKIKAINYLKIRGGYGKVGNGQGANALNTNQFNSGFNYNSSAGYSNQVRIDNNLTWETMNEYDLGIDAKFINNKLSATFDYYNRTSKNLILYVTYPSIISPDPVYTNAGEVTNKGLEASLRWEDAINDNLRYAVGGNISFNQNKLSKVTNYFFSNATGGSLGNGGYTKETHLGDPLGSFYVYDVEGYNNDGTFKYSANRINAGSFIPKYTYGINLAVYYRNIDFSTDLYGVGGNKIYNGKKAQRFGGENIEYNVLDSFWTPSTPNAANPKPSNEVPTASTYYIEDGSFLRINNITLGYSIKNLKNVVTKVRIYFTAVNPFIFTKYSGYSPEVSGSPLGNAGIELDAYPTNKTFALGVNVGF